jgi:glycosyltransferase involved in cell wall biosynthesis
VKQRVVHLIGSLEVSGATKQLTYLATRLPPADFESHVIALRANPAALEMLRSKGVEPVVIGWRGPWDAVGFWRLSQQLRRRKADIVHMWPAAFGSWPMEACARLAGIRRRVASIRRLENQGTHSAIGSARRIAKGADRVVVNSASVRNGCIASGVPAEKVTVIFDGVCPIEKSSSSRQQLLSELQLPSDAKLVAFLGGLTKQKRLKELIWATDQLKAVGTKAHLLIIGDGPLRKRLERYSWLNRLEDRVRFLGFRSDAARLVSHVDVVWQAEAGEGQSDAILEGMGAGAPVVAADSPGNRELVTPGENGYLVSLRERAGFARCTLPLLEDADLAARLGAEGRRRVEQNHRVDAMVAAHAKLYEAIL